MKCMFIIRVVLIIGTIFFLSTFRGYKAQGNLYQTDSMQGYSKNFGYGVANLIEIASNNSGYRPQAYFDLSGKNSKNYFYRIGLSFSYRRNTQGTLPVNEIIPLNITFGAEKHYYRKNFYFVLGGDFFVSMSMRKARLGPFQFDDYGMGIAAYAGCGYALRRDLTLFTQFEPGIGYFREFVGVGTVARPTLAIRYAPMRNLSFGVRHFF